MECPGRGDIIRLPIMRLVTYDRGGARRLGAWVGSTVVDLPDAVGHPAFPSTMEALVKRHAGTTLDAARAALDHPDAVSEFEVPSPRLLSPVIPSSVRVAPRANPATVEGNGAYEDVELACLLGGGGKNLSPSDAAAAVFGYALVTAVTLGPTVVTPDELEAGNPRLVITIDGKPFSEAAIDPATLAAVIATTSRDEELSPGDVFLFHAPARGVGSARRLRLRADARMDLEAGPTAWRKASGTP
jgi:2-keto-4-pentenoate hydratase/2-oxohepta-3-ene-1,7-dioic acid hydratase in catechol pathway